MFAEMDSPLSFRARGEGRTVSAELCEAVGGVARNQHRSTANVMLQHTTLSAGLLTRPARDNAPQATSTPPRVPPRDRASAAAYAASASPDGSTPPAGRPPQAVPAAPASEPPRCIFAVKIIFPHTSTSSGGNYRTAITSVVVGCPKSKMQMAPSGEPIRAPVNNMAPGLRQALALRPRRR